MSSPNPSSPSEPPASAPLQQPPPALVRPEPESRLDQLTARLETAKEKAKQAKAELDELTTAVKTELSRLCPGATEIFLHSPHLQTPWQMVQVDSWRFDSTTCKTQYPELYATFAKKSTTWRLSALRS